MASAQNTERPCSYICESHSFAKFCRLTPSEVRSQAVVRSAEGGGGHIVALLPFANSLRLSNERPFCLGFPALVNLLVMNSVFIVNGFLGTPQKKWEEGHFTTFHRKAYHV